MWKGYIVGYNIFVSNITNNNYLSKTKELKEKYQIILKWYFSMTKQLTT